MMNFDGCEVLTSTSNSADKCSMMYEPAYRLSLLYRLTGRSVQTVSALLN